MGFDLGGNIGYQNLILDKANISNGTIFSLFTSVDFKYFSCLIKKCVYSIY